MCYDGALANASTLSCFTSFYLESNKDISLSDRCWHDAACPPKKAITLGITNSEFSFGEFSLCVFSGWHVCINQLCPKRAFLLLISFVYSISLYQSFSFSQDHRGSGNQMWTRQSTRLLQTKPQEGNECMHLRVCVSVFARKGFHNFEVLTSAAGPSRDGMWYSPLHKGPWPL